MSTYSVRYDKMKRNLRLSALCFYCDDSLKRSGMSQEVYPYKLMFSFVYCLPVVEFDSPCIRNRNGDGHCVYDDLRKGTKGERGPP